MREYFGLVYKKTVSVFPSKKGWLFSSSLNLHPERTHVGCVFVKGQNILSLNRRASPSHSGP